MQLLWTLKYFVVKIHSVVIRFYIVFVANYSTVFIDLNSKYKTTFYAVKLN